MTDWEQRYRSADTPWEKGAAHPALVRWLERRPLTGRVLVPGCGSGHDVRAIAAGGAEVIGLDLAPSAVARARAHPAVGRETYVEGDYFEPPPAWRHTFDAVCEHTCYCAIEPVHRPRYARATAELLRPGGLLVAVFYLDPDAETGPPFGCTPREIDALFGATFRLEEDQTGIPTFPGRENRERLRVFRRL